MEPLQFVHLEVCLNITTVIEVCVILYGCLEVPYIGLLNESYSFLYINMFIKEKRLFFLFLLAVGNFS